MLGLDSGNSPGKREETQLIVVAFSVNHLDIAPQHASVLMGISNTVATLPGILSPILSGYVVTTPVRHRNCLFDTIQTANLEFCFQTAEEWKLVFFITSGIYLFGAIIYGCFASGEIQPWALETQTLKQDEPTKPTKPTGIENESFHYDL